MKKNLFLFNQLFLIILFSLFSQLLFLSPSIYALNVFNKVLPTGDVETLIGLTVLFLSLAAFGALFDYVRRSSLAQLSVWVYTQMLPGAFETDSLLSGLKEQKTPEDSCIGKVEQMTGFLRQGSFLNLIDTFYSIFFILLIYLIDFRLGLYVTICWIVLLCISLWFHHHNIRMNANKNLSVWRRTSAQLMRLKPWLLITNKTKPFSKHYYNQIGQKADQASHELTKAQKQQSSMTGLRIVMQMGVYGLAAYWVSQASLSVGTIIAVALLTGRSLDPLLMFGASIRDFKKFWKNWKSFELINKTVNRKRFLNHQIPHKNIRLHTNFSVKKPEFTLNVPEFLIQSGQGVHIIGESGTGKTLISQIILGFVPVEEGFVTKYITEKDRIGYVDKAASLFPGSILDNICGYYGKKTPKQIEAANEIVALLNMYEHLSLLNLKLEDPLPVKGLPSALMHDLVLARAFYGMPALMILDEPNALISLKRRHLLFKLIEKSIERGTSCILLSQNIGFSSKILKPYELKIEKKSGLTVSLEQFSPKIPAVLPEVLV